MGELSRVFIVTSKLDGYRDCVVENVFANAGNAFEYCDKLMDDCRYDGAELSVVEYRVMDMPFG